MWPRVDGALVPGRASPSFLVTYSRTSSARRPGVEGGGPHGHPGPSPGVCEPSEAGAADPVTATVQPRRHPGAKRSLRLSGKNSSSTVACAYLYTESPFLLRHGQLRFRLLSVVCSLPLGSKTLTPEPKNSFPLLLYSELPGTGLLSRDRAVTPPPADAQPSALQRTLSAEVGALAERHP